MSAGNRAIMNALMSISPKTVLIVEDMFTMRIFIKALLRPKGFNFLEAEDGLLALKLLQTARPDLILSDLEMPHLNGLELCKRVRAIPHLSKVPFLLLTGRGRNMDRGEAEAAGISDFLSKPINAEELEATVAKFLLPAGDAKG